MKKKQSGKRPLAVLSVFDDVVEVKMTLPNRTTIDKVVTLTDLAGAFHQPDLSSGVLPGNCLFWRRVNSADHLAVYMPPASYDVMAFGQRYRLPMPGFIFAGWLTEYSLFAVSLEDDEWPTATTALYFPPLSNLYNSGKICAGQNTFPVCTAETIWQAWRDLWASEFTNHVVNNRVSGANVIEFFNQIDGQPAFPLSRLLPFPASYNQGTLATLLESKMGGRYE